MGKASAIALVAALAVLRAHAAEPGPPPNLAASITGSTVTLTWIAPIAGDPVSGYLIEAGSTPGARNLANVLTSTTVTTFTAVSVPPGTYFVRVRAMSATTVGPPSNEIVVTIGAGQCLTPDPPLGLAIRSAVGSSIEFAWRTPTANPSFRVQAGSAPGLADLGDIALQGAATSFSAIVTAPGAYYVRVRAENTCGAGPPSNEVRLVIGPGVTILPRLDERNDAGVFLEGSSMGLVQRVAAPLIDGSSLRCGLTGGTPYSNVHCYVNLPAAPPATFFQLDLHFSYPATTFKQ